MGKEASSQGTARLPKAPWPLQCFACAWDSCKVYFSDHGDDDTRQQKTGEMKREMDSVYGHGGNPGDVRKGPWSMESPPRIKRMKKGH